MVENPKAIIYARVSTVGQAEEDLPIDGQLELCRLKAEKLGATVVREFVDPGISGRTDKRDAFQSAVAFCKFHGIDYFICWNTARFARNKIDAPLYKRDLARCGTEVVYVTLEIDRKTNAGWMVESIYEIFDEHYSRQISEDTMRGMLKNARDGFFNGGRVPFGYKAVESAVGKRKRLEIFTEEADVVLEIFKQYLSGLGAKSIAMLLNESCRTFRGKKWSKNTVSNMLKNNVYAGYITFNRWDRSTGVERPQEDWIVTKSHDAIISEEDFMMVQKLFGDRAPLIGGGSPHSTFVFTGLLKCGYCENGMQIETGTGRSRVYSYYNCWSAIKGLGCHNHRISTEYLDQALIDKILDEILTTESLVQAVRELKSAATEWVTQRTGRRESLVKELRDTETRLRNLYDILELHGKEAPNLGDLATRMRELRSARDRIELDLIKLESEDEPSITIQDEDVVAMAELMRDVVNSTSDGKKLRQFFSTFIDRVIVFDERVEIEYNEARIMNRAISGTVHSNAIWLPDLGSNQGHMD